jgi:ribosome biogenesis protein MAK21
MESALIDDIQLNKLTAKLEQKLRNDGSARESGKGREKKGKERRNDGDHKSRPQPEKARPEKTPSKKRDSRGKTKVTTDPPSKPLGAAKDKGQEKATKPAPEAKLRQEVLELGGTEDDFALVAEITSDSEVEGPTTSGVKGTKASKGLEKDVASFMQKLGIHGASQDSVSAEDESPNEASAATGKSKGGSADVMEGRPPPAAKAGQMVCMIRLIK